MQELDTTLIDDEAAAGRRPGAVAALVVPAIGAGGLSPFKAWRLARLLRAGVGGFNLIGGSAGSIARLTAWLRHRTRRPLLLGADLEGNSFYSIGAIPDLPPNMAIGAAGSLDLAKSVGEARGAVARRLGLNTIFGPCLDINGNAANPIINVRSFGSDPRAVASLGTAMLAGIENAGVLAVPKHFPGHGEISVDSHLELPRLGAARATLAARELVPFAAAIAAGARAMMAAHLIVPGLGDDVHPASLSAAVLGHLRTHMGFSGLVFTDALLMGAITSHYSEAGAARRALAAGADILLMPARPGRLLGELERARRRGEIPAAVIAASAARLAAVVAALEKAAPAPEIDIARVAKRAARASLTLVRHDCTRLSLPLAGSGAPFPFLALFAAGLPQREDLAAHLARRGIPTRRVQATMTPDAAAWRDAIAALPPPSKATRDVVLVALFSPVVPYAGRVGLPSSLAAALAALAQQRPLAVVSFGSPYLLEQIPAAAVYVCAWGDGASLQEAAADLLTGGLAPTGRLPVPVAGYPLGHGLSRLGG